MELMAVFFESLHGDEIVTAVVCGLTVVLAFATAGLLWRWSWNWKTGTCSKVHPNQTTKQRALCPFSAESNFLVETAVDLPPTPLELLESWVDPAHPDFGKYPLAARWLDAGISGQDTPGILRAGLKRLQDSKFFLVEEPFRHKGELTLKQKALDDPKRFPLVFVAESDAKCLQAQQECLELFLHYLPRRYPDLYSYNHHKNSIHVKSIDTTFLIKDYQQRPLELCERIVQEDLILMRPPKRNTGEQQYAMAAAAVVFSFVELNAKLGKPVAFIHAPVPGYEKHLRRTLDLTFSKLLKAEAPMWRNNWGLAPSGELDKPLYGSPQGKDFDSRNMTRAHVEAMFLKVEYQTIRRLPTSGYLLFTVKTMADPMSSLKQTPKAAACLAESIRGMSQTMRVYKGIQTNEVCKVVLKYLDSIAKDSDDVEGKETKGYDGSK
jgi:dimethylamine monooxygenase subunit A